MRIDLRNFKIRGTNQKIFFYFVVGYFFCIGCLLIYSSFSFYGEQQKIFLKAYKDTAQTVEDSKKNQSGYKFIDETQKQKYADALGDIEGSLVKFKGVFIDSVPVDVFLSRIINVFVGVMYVFSGISVFRRSLYAKEFLKLAVRGYILDFCIKFMGVGYLLFFISQIINNITSIITIADPESVNNSMFFTPQTTALMGFGILVYVSIGVSFFIIFPKVFLSRLEKQ